MNTLNQTRLRVVLLAIFVAGIVLAGATANTYAHDALPKVEAWEQAMNQETYWERNGWRCTKYEDNPNVFIPAVTGTKYKTIVKGGQWVNIYWRLAHPPHVHGWKAKATPDTFTTIEWDFGVSWKTVCSKPEEPKRKPKVVAPKARILGPCGDPWFGAVLNNKRSERPVAFVVRWHNGNQWRTVKRVLRGGERKVFGPRYVIGGKRVTVRRGNGTLLASETFRAGFYGWRSSECQLLRPSTSPIPQ